MRVILVGVAISMAACPRQKEAPAHVDASMASRVVVDAAAAPPTGDLRREDFERIDPTFAAGTSKLCGRGAFLPEGDLRAFSAGDFLGRATSLFGPPDRGTQGMVLRHRPTGIVVTVYRPTIRRRSCATS
jgi:hypothetical protein